jgi:EAL domain-containing protein (putative c-di-GMP-specific phosphodiesterase class I)
MRYENIPTFATRDGTGGLTPSGGVPVDYDSLCQQIRVAMEPVRAQAVSLHDESGDLLWLTESSMGPDEHHAVQQAFESFASGSGPTAVAYDLGDSRSAVLFRVTDAKRAMVGAAMVIVDTRAVGQNERGAGQLLTQKLLRVLGTFAVTRRRLEPAAPVPAPKAASTAAPAARAAPTHDIELPELTLTPMSEITLPAPMPRVATPANGSTEIDRLNATLRNIPIALYVQRLMPLTKGSTQKRFEVLLRSTVDPQNSAPQAMLKAAADHGLGSMIDRRVLAELVGWLVRNPGVYQDDDGRFSVNLTKTALHDEHFVKFVSTCLAKAALPPQTIAFEIDAALAITSGGRIAELAAALHRLGCPLVLDDFGLKTECFELLRLPGLKYIKLAPSITKQMRTDKVSQAAITALVQMARVLGLYTVAKHTASGAEQEWMTALGVDFVQSNALSAAVPIESLAKAASLRRTP